MTRFTKLQAVDVTLGYGGEDIVRNVSIEIARAGVTAIVGPNACGKSTLLRALSRLRPVGSGAVLLDGHDIAHTGTRELARKLGVLPQAPVAPEGVTVLDLVSRGRYPHQSWLRPWSDSDEAAVTRALEATGTVDLAERRVDELSGGQRQRVWIAMTLAQDTDVILLDEPTTYLDLAHQLEVLDLLADLNHQAGKTIVMVLHDLNHAAMYSDHLIAMHEGRVASAGPPADVLDEALLRDLFGVDCRVVTDLVHGAPTIVPIGRHGRFVAGSEDGRSA